MSSCVAPTAMKLYEPLVNLLCPQDVLQQRKKISYLYFKPNKYTIYTFNKKCSNTYIIQISITKNREKRSGSCDSEQEIKVDKTIYALRETQFRGRIYASISHKPFTNHGIKSIGFLQNENCYYFIIIMCHVDMRKRSWFTI